MTPIVANTRPPGRQRLERVTEEDLVPWLGMHRMLGWME